MDHRSKTAMFSPSLGQVITWILKGFVMKVLLLLIFMNGGGSTYSISEDMPNMGTCEQMKAQVLRDAKKADQVFLFGDCYLK